MMRPGTEPMPDALTQRRLPPHVRFESPELIGHKSTVIFVGSDGTETDISNCVRAVDFRLRMGELNTATIEVLATAESLLIYERTVRIRLHWHGARMWRRTVGFKFRRWRRRRRLAISARLPRPMRERATKSEAV